MSTQTISLGSGPLTAKISPIGAELTSLCLNGQEWLWQGDSASWPRQAPVLFPFCGRTRNRQIRVGGKVFDHQPIHGFAPESRFEIADQTADSLILELTETPATRALYPFAFRLRVTFALDGTALHQEIEVANEGPESLPVSAGFHPGFQWPVPGAAGQTDPVIRFETDEPDPVALPDADGLMGGETLPSPVKQGVLSLTGDIFKAGSLVFDRLRSRSLWYGVPSSPGLAIRFTTPFLVLWRWPGPGAAPFICIEPWAGLPDPAGFGGDVYGKPGITSLPVGHSTKWCMSLTPGA